MSASEYAAVLDAKGRCCGRKPLVYLGKHTTREGPQRFCPRCDRSYGLETERQMANWAYSTIDNGETFYRAIPASPPTE